MYSFSFYLSPHYNALTFYTLQAKIEMYSKYERQKDKRPYNERHGLFTGPQFASPAEKVQPQRNVLWDDLTATMYYDGSGAPPPAAAPEPEAAPAEAE